MMYTISEAFELFCDQYPQIKISRSTFCNCMHDHIMLRGNTPANMCLSAYYENMWLLVSAIEKFPPVTDLLQHVERDVNCWQYMVKSCECCCKLLLRKYYCRKTFTDKDLYKQITYHQWINNTCGRLEHSKASETVADAPEEINQKIGHYFFMFPLKDYRSE